MRITVLCGGPSSEREVSLISGKGVAEALREAGHEVTVSDISPDNLSALDIPADVVFPVLHGEFGESGELQEILEARGLPFVGSGSTASRLAMDKIAAKQVWRDRGLPTPAWRVHREIPSDPAELGLPAVVKAIRSGSSIDVYICKTVDDVTAAAAELLRRHDEFMVEQFIAGTELTVGLLEDRPLPVIKIETGREWYDYKAKYTQGQSKHNFDPGLPADVVENARSLALAASRALGCRDLGRADIMVDAAHACYLLEINTIPGFTPMSLLPDAAREAGISFPQLVDRLARLAAQRGTRPAAIPDAAMV